MSDDGELWELPEGWAWKPLGEVCARTGTIDPSKTPSRIFRYLDIGGVDNDGGRIVRVKSLEGRAAPSRARREVQADDVVFASVRPYLRNIALVSKEDQIDVCSTGFVVLRASPGVSARYLFHVVRSTDFIRALLPDQTGTMYPAVSDKDVLAQFVPIPPFQEQTRLVEILEPMLARVSEERARLERVKKNAARARRSVLAAAFRGELTKAWRGASDGGGSDGENVEEGKRFPVPKGWAWSTIGTSFPVHVGATPPRKEPTYWQGSIPWVSSGEVSFCRIKSTRETITTSGLDSSSTRLNPIGSVLLGMIGEGRTRGQAAILDIEAANNQNCAAIWVSATKTPPEYVYFWLVHQYQRTRDDGAGNNQQALNKSSVQAIPIPLPPLDEQREIVRIVDRWFAVLDDVERRVDRGLAACDRLRESLIQKAFRGELLPRAATKQPATKPAAKAAQLTLPGLSDET